jgi:hypothetical protein
MVNPILTSLDAELLLVSGKIMFWGDIGAEAITGLPGTTYPEKSSSAKRLV